MADNLAHVVWIMLAVALVASALISRRVPLTRLIAWTAGWALLFLGIYYLFTMIEPQVALWQQSRRGGEVKSISVDAPAAPGHSSGTTVVIPMAQDGHYWVEAMVGGQKLRLLVDSGASITALSQDTANRLALPADPMNRTVVMQTANGQVSAQRSSVPLMDISTIQVDDLAIIVSPAFGNVNVLGMNFLNKLKSWRVENGSMILEPN